MKHVVLTFSLLSCLIQFGIGQILYKQNNGYIHFRSNAPLEIIEASSQKLRGLVDLEKRTFAFSVNSRSFEGFNSPLQKEHFNENYLESKKFPQTTFIGKIIERIDPNKEGTYQVRAKGKLIIHGVEQERIIKAKLIVKRDQLTINTTFNISLSEHDISIPKIVYQKIAEIIQVRVKATLLAVP